MIMRKHDEDYKEVGFIKKKVNGDYKDVQKIYRRDEDGNYRVIFERGYGTEYDGANDFRVPAVGKDLKNYTIFGNSEQNGFPTPESPIEPEFCGDLVSIELDEPLRAVGDYKDTLDLATGVLTRRIGKYVVTGSEDISNSYGRMIFWGAFFSASESMISTAYPPSNAGVGRIIGWLNGGVYRAMVTDTGLSTAEFTTLITTLYNSGEPMIIYYALTTPTTETVSVSSGLTGVIEGTVTQSGTPTPDNPIEPVFNGKLLPNGKYQVYKTYKIPILSGGVNLFDELVVQGSVAENTSPVGSPFSQVFKEAVQLTRIKSKNPCPCNGCTVSWDDSIFKLGFLYFDENLGYLQKYDIWKTSSPFTLPNYPYMGIIIAYKTNVDITPSVINDINIMLNYGSTPLPYEPYVTPTVKNIYLGQVQTTRRIKKLVLTGEETVALQTTNVFFVRFAAQPTSASNTIGISNQYQSAESIAVLYARDYSYQNDTGYYRVRIHDSRFETVEDFKAYLAAQYAAGTPVTVWYVLAEPEVGIVNEPLCRIGDYADTINLSQAGVSIPTLPDPQTTLITIPTSVPPSEIIANYKAYKRPKYPPFLTKDGKTFDTKNGQSLYLGGYE